MRSMFCLFALALVTVAAQAANTVAVQRRTPYSEDAMIAGKIKRECTIDTQMPGFIAEYGKNEHIDVQLVDKADKDMQGRVLLLKIIDARSSGNAFIGHHKSMTVSGELYQDGKMIGSFKGRRNSMGGVFAGFKGSCSVLGRTAKALGEDIARWLAHPGENDMLGDLH